MPGPASRANSHNQSMRMVDLAGFLISGDSGSKQQHTYDITMLLCETNARGLKMQIQFETNFSSWKCQQQWRDALLNEFDSFA